ncbi:non-ribosomal peptide synthetase [Streptomyces virginiae]|uniref:non-ribosomal peptide synthetase n=1 Tax=Streptomyces virginiae TaxID=1961 RepID=UPI002257C342|nr:condensation domain-containing protein [Streptomyces virginiae]MCX4957531.1 condensation domain-containing protein [Streptomyces virginiae]
MPDLEGDGHAGKRHSRMVPASSPQRRMYFSSVMRPNNTSDVWRPVLTVAGDLSTDRLERALQVLRSRHEAFRTTFLERGGEVFQLVHDEDGDATQPVLIDLVEAEGDSHDERRAWADAEARRVVDLPFDISSGPLWRTSVIRISPSLHLVVFAFHHIITDEISGKVFAEELRLAYADPHAPAFAVPAAQYADFCLTENASELDEAALDYWRGQLAGIRPASMPEDGEEIPGRMLGSRLPIAVPQNVVADFEEFCRARSVTPFAGMLSVYFVLLQRWAGTSDISVGTQTLGRPNPELFGTIGFFSNTVALRCQVDSALTFDQLLDLVSETVHDALDYQDIPFEVVVGALAPERDADRNPLFQAAITYGMLDLSDVWALEGLQVTLLPEPAELSGLQFDLSLDIQRLAGEVSLNVEFNRRRFSEAAMQRFAKAYGDLLGSLSRQPDVALGSIPLLDQAALTETLALGASGEPEGGRTPSEPTSAWDLFELTAATVPEREAVVADGARLTFAELAGRARTMAAGLEARGVRTGTVVGICLDRRSDLIVAMLATWCAGGAFLLLDPQHPEFRRRLLLEEAGIALVITDEAFAEVEAVSPATLLADAEKTSGDDPADGGFARRPAAAPAYVVFTPGSTGQPRGVVIDQASLLALATTQLAPVYARLPEGRQVNVGALSSLTSGVFVNQCLGMIAFGHRLLLIDEEERTDPYQLLARGSDPETAIDVLDCASGRLEMLVDDGLLTLPHPPKIVVIGGESPSDRLWQRLHDQPGLLAFHAYGLNECTVESARAEIREHPKPVAGRAAGTSRIYVVDDQLQLLPPMFVGEICIGGLGVAQGYAGQPAHTSERFVADPFSHVPGRRMYRTGDKGRLRPDGQLELWGRLDDQVKIRGLRMEPAEVEGVLLGHPAIAHAAVVATQAGARMAELVAYVVPGDEGQDALTPATVREFLRGRLPSALLPDRVQVLAALPTTPDGKLDRRTLSGGAPSSMVSDTVRSVSASADPLERQLCQIVADVIGVPQTGADDNFFDLGGDSLLAMIVIGRVRAVMGCELRLRAFFDMRSLGELAAQLSTEVSAPRPVLGRRADS